MILQKPPHKETVHLDLYYDGVHSGSASGVMIAPNKVLTVAHAIINTNTGTIANRVVVYPGRVGESAPFGTATASTYHILSAFIKDGFRTPTGTVNQFQNDLAVLTLDRSLNTGYLRVSSKLAIGERVMQTGYPGDKGKIQHYSYGLAEAFEGAVIKHRLDSVAGISGAPMLNSQNQVVAINFAGAPVKIVNNTVVNVVPDDYPHLNLSRVIDQVALELVDVAVNNKPATKNVTALIPTYRLYNKDLKRHIFTARENERDALMRVGWTYEGIAWHTNSKGRPVYRLYNSSLQKHLYTSDENEVKVLAGRGWQNEGMAWYSDGNVLIYRLYHEGLQTHLFTKNQWERNDLVSKGWRDEGFSWKVLH